MKMINNDNHNSLFVTLFVSSALMIKLVIVVIFLLVVIVITVNCCHCGLVGDVVFFIPAVSGNCFVADLIVDVVTRQWQ